MDAPAPRPGVCRFCGCTYETPCFNLSTGETCSWLEDTNQTVCTSAECIKQWAYLLEGTHDNPRMLP